MMRFEPRRVPVRTPIHPLYNEYSPRHQQRMFWTSMHLHMASVTPNLSATIVTDGEPGQYIVYAYVVLRGAEQAAAEAGQPLVG